MKGGVYQLRCTPTGERYIGSSSNLNRRRLAHASQLRRGKHPVKRLNDLATEHGPDAFVFEILSECIPSALKDRERDAIQEHQPELNARTDKIGGVFRTLNRKRINITLPVGMPESLDAVALNLGKDRSRLIEELCAAFLEQQKPKKPRK